MRSIRKATALLLLFVIGSPATLGVALHRVQDFCLSDELVAAKPHCECCCSQSRPVPAKSEIAAESCCLVCDFLAIAKHDQSSPPPQISTGQVPSDAYVIVAFLFAQEVLSSDLARGPPTV